jgi:hypothetical protein
MSWFYYDWLPGRNTSVPINKQDGLTLAQAYLRQKGKNLEPLLVRYIEQCCAAPFSFFDIVSCQPGSGFILRDIFTGEQVNVTERSGSQYAQFGDIVFGKVVKIDHVAMLEACTPVMIPPDKKAPILEYRKQIQSDHPQPLTAALLKKYDLGMIDIYHRIVNRLLNPVMPMVQNTDGEAFLPQRLIYEIDSPRATFDALRHLCLTVSPDEMLDDATFDATGELCEIAFPWQKPGNKKHKSWDNTVLGHINITGRKLTAEVNSENRAKKFRAIMAKLLPSQACYQTTVVESLDALLAASKKNKNTAVQRERTQKNEHFNALPEVQAQLTEAMQAHYRNWIHEKLPALNNKTPIQAVKTVDGREMVEALLIQLERGVQNMQAMDASFMAELRASLGLMEKSF